MFETITKKEKLKEAKEMFRKAIGADRTFQAEARDSFMFRDGEQWTEQEKKLLKDELRPCLTFNLTKRFIELVKGLYEEYRVRYVASPIEQSDGFLAEVLNDIARWVRENWKFEEEEDISIESATICGRGWTAIDFNIDPKNFDRQFIKVFLKNIPVHECRREASARRSDLSDCSILFWDKWMTVEDFRISFPDHAQKVKDYLTYGHWIDDPAAPLTPDEVFEPDVDIDQDESDYDVPMDTTYWDKSKKMIRVIHAEHWFNYQRYFAFNPATGKIEEFDKKDLKKLEQLYPRLFGEEFDYQKIWDKKIKWFQFIGEDILYDGDSPMPFDDYSITPAMAYFDVSLRSSKNYGIEKMIHDPQLEVNKRWSQTLNLINKQSAPGAYAETDAFVDKDQAEHAMKTPGEIAWLESGALQQGKFQEREIPQFPAATFKMEEASQNIMLKILGINPDLLGMDRGREDPGIAVRLRQQQGIMMLRPLFKSFRMHDQKIFEKLVSIIVKYMPDEQIMQIIGQNDRYAVQNGVIIDKQFNLQAPLRDIRNLKYNIKPEEQPGNQNHRMFVLSVLSDLANKGFPVDPSQIINKLDIPESEKQQWLKFIEMQQQAQKEAADREFKLEMAKIQAKTMTDKERSKLDGVIKMQKVKEQKAKDREKFDIEREKLDQDDVRMQLDYLVRDKQADAQMKSVEQNKANEG